MSTCNVCDTAWQCRRAAKQSLEAAERRLEAAERHYLAAAEAHDGGEHEHMLGSVSAWRASHTPTP